MATKNFDAPQKMVPVSTVLALLCIYFWGTIEFLFLLNLVSMFFFHLFRPKFAAGLAHNRVYCGEIIREFYTSLALKWPFRWAKWWVTPDILKNYSVKEQGIYLKDVRCDETALWALSPEAWALFMSYHADMFPMNTLIEGMKERDDLFAALLDQTSMDGREQDLLKQYMHNSPLPKTQMEILVAKACDESAEGELGVLSRVLGKYIERCGISPGLRRTVSKQAPEILREVVATSDEAYNQKCFTRRCHDLICCEVVDMWKDFCASNKKICVVAQQEMSYNQYAIFLKQGHHLDKEAIIYHLCHSKGEMAELIFRNEPKFGILDETVEAALDKYAYLRPILQDVMKETEQKRLADSNLA